MPGSLMKDIDRYDDVRHTNAHGIICWNRKTTSLLVQTGTLHPLGRPIWVWYFVYINLHIEVISIFYLKN